MATGMVVGTAVGADPVGASTALMLTAPGHTTVVVIKSAAFLRLMACVGGACGSADSTYRLANRLRRAKIPGVAQPFARPNEMNFQKFWTGRGELGEPPFNPESRICMQCFLYAPQLRTETDR